VKRKRKQDSDGRTSPAPRIATLGEVFDGASIELIRNPATDRPGLLLWDGGMETAGTLVEFKGRIYEPAPMDHSLWRELTLPTHCRAHGSTRELLAEACKLVSQFVGLPDKLVALAGRIVLISWLVEAVQTAPGLAIGGLGSPQGNQLIGLLQCLCRHPLRLSGVTPGKLCSLPTGAGFTLLISQSTISDRLSKLLDDVSRRDNRIPHGGGMLDLYGCHALHSESILDGAMSLRLIPVPVLPTNQRLPALDRNTQRRIAADLQPKFLGFRRANLETARHTRFDASTFIYPLRELAETLAAATPDDTGLQEELLDLLRGEDTEIRSAHWVDLSTVAIEAVLVTCEDTAGKPVYVGELTKIAQEIWKGRGKNTELDPGTFGRQLRHLGFTTEPRDAKGVKLLLTEAVCRRARQLASDHGVPSPTSDERLKTISPVGENDGSAPLQ
jgi:hypothetical protein